MKFGAVRKGGLGMKNKIAVILPYFGILPNYFKLFLKSAEENKDFDFFIFTDCKVKSVSHNIKIFHESFDWFQKKLQAVIDIPIVLDTPYKLCDYKPVYGQALQDYINSYDFWGHCDSDIILGRLTRFLNDNILNSHDRIYHLGHFCLYRNNREMNQLYKIKHTYEDCFSYKYVYNTKFVCAYDEIGTKYGFGLSEVCRRMKVGEYRHSADFADIDPKHYQFHVWSLKEEGQQHWEYFEKAGGVLLGYQKTGKYPREFAYIHLQKRKMFLTDGISEDRYYISPCAFRATKEEAVNDADNQTNQFRRYMESLIRMPKRKLDKVRKGAIKVFIDRKLGHINA